MRSFRRQPDNRRSIYLQLAGSIEGQLRQAYAKRQEEDDLSQAELAGKLGVNRSVVHRRLTGRRNMTVETIADMVWALGHCIKVDIFDPQSAVTNEPMIIPSNDAGMPGPSSITSSAMYHPTVTIPAPEQERVQA